MNDEFDGMSDDEIIKYLGSFVFQRPRGAPGAGLSTFFNQAYAKKEELTIKNVKIVSKWIENKLIPMLRQLQVLGTNAEMKLLVSNMLDDVVILFNKLNEVENESQIKGLAMNYKHFKKLLNEFENLKRLWSKQ